LGHDKGNEPKERPSCPWLEHVPTSVGKWNRASPETSTCGFQLWEWECCQGVWNLWTKPCSNWALFILFKIILKSKISKWDHIFKTMIVTQVMTIWKLRSQITKMILDYLVIVWYKGQISYDWKAKYVNLFVHHFGYQLH
jgi:hypothetical protein